MNPAVWAVFGIVLLILAVVIVAILYERGHQKAMDRNKAELAHLAELTKDVGFKWDGQKKR